MQVAEDRLAPGDGERPGRGEVGIGAEDQAAAVRVASLYLGITAPVIVTDPASAETIKYAANAFLATKVSFINAVAAVCEAVGADIKDVALGMGYDSRIGHEFLRPGPGWGGSCFPKDTRAMIRIAEDAGYDFNLLKGVVTVNDEQLSRIADKVVGAAGGSVFLAWPGGSLGALPLFAPLALPLPLPGSAQAGAAVPIASAAAAAAIPMPLKWRARAGCMPCLRCHTPNQ